jgi:hypothetical protein
MNILRTAICGVVVAMLLAACGNATEGMTFKVPAGYQSKINIFGMEMWTSGDSVHPSMIMLVTIPKKFDPSNASDFNFNNVSNSSTKNTKFTSRRRITMCGKLPAFRADAVGTNNPPSPAPSASGDKSKSDQDLDMIVTGWGGKTYMAMYARPHGTSADPAAEATLLTLCPAVVS